MLQRLALLSVFAVLAPAQEAPNGESAQIRLSGTVIEVSGSAVKVRVPHDRVWLVHVSLLTNFGVHSRQLSVGQEVDVAAIRERDGEVDARRVAVYNTDLPLREGFGK